MREVFHADSNILCQKSGPGQKIFIQVATVLQIYLAEYGVFIVELICTSQGEEKLTAIIMRPSICHGDQTSPIEAQSGVKFILKDFFLKDTER